MGLRATDKPRSYRDMVYQAIKEAIISHQLKPGMSLHERALAEQLSVSRTPVREALKRLEMDGLVISEPWKGAVVAPIRREDITEVFQLRRANEALVVELVATRWSDADIQRLDELLKNQAEAMKDGDRVRFINIDRQWHEALTSLSGNRRLIQLLHNISDHVKRLGIQAITRPERMQETLFEHRAILRALQRRDVVAARCAMMMHIVNTHDAILGTLDEARNLA